MNKKLCWVQHLSNQKIKQGLSWTICHFMKKFICSLLRIIFCCVCKAINPAAGWKDASPDSNYPYGLFSHLIGLTTINVTRTYQIVHALPIPTLITSFNATSQSNLIWSFNFTTKGGKSPANSLWKILPIMCDGLKINSAATCSSELLLWQPSWNCKKLFLKMPFDVNEVRKMEIYSILILLATLKRFIKTFSNFQI